MNKGYVLNGRYEIINRLGEGGMADVYLAEDLILKRKVAVKLLRLDFRDNPKAKKRFQHEAMAATELDNPHIVGIYDVDEVEGMQYLVMEYVDGEDLKQYIKDRFPIPYAEVVDIMEQICSAVSEAHRHNIIHRDLKPQNILVDKKGYIKITDFGISRAGTEDTMTQTRSIIGSIHYLSPEQIKGEMATQQSDIYSLGIILYQILTGKVPFNGDTAVSIAIKHSQEPMPSVRDFDPRIPQALENVVLRATTKDPKDRYRTVNQLADDLNTSLDKSRANESKFIVPDERQKVDEKTRVMPFNALPSSSASANESDAQRPLPNDNENRSADKRPQKRMSKRKRRWLILGGILAFLVLLLTLVMIVTANGKTTVPVITGTEENEASQKIKSADLRLGKVRYHSSDTIDRNRVISSNPHENTKVKKNTKVSLVVSSGPRKVRVDNYVGQNYDQVKQRLESEGFKVRRRNAPSSSFRTGRVLQQDFEAGKKMNPAKHTLTFVVSTGIKQITLEDLTGMSKAQVISYANKEEINPTFDYVYSSDQPKGRVVKQSPAANTSIRQGGNVAVSLSRGSKTKKNDDLKSFDVRVTIPYFDGNQGSSSASSAFNNSQGTQAPASSSSAESATPEPTSAETPENVVLIYLKDHDHDFGTVYKQMVITKDTAVSLPFKLTKNEVGRYKIVRDGQTILRDNNITYDSH
ncbi:Stk1 family PASTA domain-containing Ser/Thr kinase [Lentilactobacillus diolivorans]|uniref:Stk1 family PASTA domain-containing Ser/Thr kinase n=1 Tax=Lentilactobacillus diolivorans TaxID=179838 RepID=UPI00246985F0|nr:Stk1 family PASTA domain-containing Ser/Thr kinase [Lentilactobacillus diolivorans]MDH5104341.1 Stk1 family PASTA domain-containing Ser/Thr kinase [Lentilactobacillus diolivorans]